MTTTIQATGRRKTSTAKIFLRSGTGKITINNKEWQAYFPDEVDQVYLAVPLHVLNKAQAYDINVKVMGGGTTGQRGAIRLGISRALVMADPTWRSELKEHKLLTRDSRKVQRKKYGYRKARKKEPFRKR